MSGWLFSGRAIVTRMIVAAGSGATKHFPSYHRPSSAASRSLDAMGLAVLTMSEPVLGDVVMLGRDDTPARKRGQRLPSPADMLEGRCRRISLSIDGRSYRSRIADEVARVFAVPGRPLRGVASEALDGGRGKEAFSSTCHEATAEQVVGRYAVRWSVEATFRDSKQGLGFEEPQGWSREAVEQTAPLAMFLHSLVVLWFAREGHRLWQPPTHRWYPSRADPSVRDMLRTLRRASVRQHVLAMAPSGRGSRSLARLLEHAVAMAARRRRDQAIACMTRG